MSNLRAALLRATEHLKYFYQGKRGVRQRRRAYRTLQARNPVLLKRSFIG